MQTKNAENNQPSRFLSLLFPLCLVTASLDLVAADKQAPEERWFEIEVILYKANSDSGLTNESWDMEAPFTLPENYQDFLNPVGPAELLEGADEALSDINSHQSAANSADASSVNRSKAASDTQADSTKSSVNRAIDDIEDELLEKPFVPLEKELLQLQKEAKNISVHPSFRLLAHFAWRQPVAGKSAATSVRFAGGHDYSETFEFNGSKKLELDSQQLSQDQLSASQGLNSDEQITAPITKLTGEQQQLALFAQREKSLSSQKDSQPAPLVEVQGSPITGQLPNSEEQVLLPWVPEIDGSAKVYIYRNYLHLDADLVYRKPGQLEVDIYSLDSKLNFEDEPLIAPITPSMDELKPTTDSTQISSQQQSFDEVSKDDQFAWHFDSDFLNQDSEKVYTEKLFNYPLKQTRRMRSTELHYFDHPKIGMLVVIRPYEIESKDEPSVNR